MSDIGAMMFGFGQTETDNESYERDEIGKIVRRVFVKYDQFDSRAIECIRGLVDRRAREQKRRDKAIMRLDRKDRPERYYYTYPYILGDCNYVVAVITFHHINTQHPFSPDGIALLQNKNTFSYDLEEVNGH